jgi:hypothetical protein
MYKYKVNTNRNVVSQPEFSAPSNGALGFRLVESFMLKMQVECKDSFRE